MKNSGFSDPVGAGVGSLIIVVHSRKADVVFEHF